MDCYAPAWRNGLVLGLCIGLAENETSSSIASTTVRTSILIFLPFVLPSSHHRLAAYNPANVRPSLLRSHIPKGAFRCSRFDPTSHTGRRSRTNQDHRVLCKKRRYPQGPTALSFVGTTHEFAITMDSAKQRLLGEIIARITPIVAGCPDGSTDVMTRLLAESNRVRCDVHLKFAT